MIAVTEGVVMELVGRGFRLAPSEGTELLARTRVPGRKLRLQVGDKVLVYGHLDGDELVCSEVFRTRRDGTRAEVQISWSSTSGGRYRPEDDVVDVL